MRCLRVRLKRVFIGKSLNRSLTKVWTGLTLVLGLSKLNLGVLNMPKQLVYLYAFCVVVLFVVNVVVS